ncbi:hypothetical protein CYFUS_001703 [Cystobacter fuscus]|uniref:Uncharacterized protein n=1 Tax=Cystobacter fuscus TaxID=43 RepID=A0A250IX30_9BACT|nr:hypothetical protein [Cystobacter fuscus]ATB36289.1 hypothetical protein CYFUS_001703 [Cystobacter fuscus]
MKTAHVVVAAVVAAAVTAGAVAVWRRRKVAAPAVSLVPAVEKPASGVPAPVVVKAAVVKSFAPEPTPIFAPRAEVVNVSEVPSLPVMPPGASPGIVAPKLVAVSKNTGIVPRQRLGSVVEAF